MKLSGYLRGINISANDLVYIPGLGTFQLEKIEQHQFKRDVCSKIFVYSRLVHVKRECVTNDLFNYFKMTHRLESNSQMAFNDQ